MKRRTEHPGPGIRARRIASGLTQEELARLAQVSLATIARVEASRCRPNPLTLSAIERVLARHASAGR